MDVWQYKSGLPDIFKGWYMISHQGIKSHHTFQAALYLGLRQQEWLFLSCHNYWIVLCLVRRGDNKPPFLAFSPSITMDNSSVPFRAFLGCILSVAKGGVVEASMFNNDMVLDTIDEEVEEGSLSTSDADDGSGEYRGRSGGGPAGPAGPGPPTRKRAQDASTNTALTVRPSCAPFYLNGLSEIHLNRFRHLPHCLLNHFKFGSIFMRSLTTSLIFRQLSTMANNVFG